VLDTPVLDVNTEIGDHRPGVAVTLGKMVFCSSSDDLFHSDLIHDLGWQSDLHADSERALHARGALQRRKDHHHRSGFSASAVHADQWVPVKVATDAALGLSMAHVMIEEGIYNRKFVKEQTDLPLLVRTDIRAASCASPTW
jgi:anaerobic selenocysteine-containing dehydrogenase